MPQTQQTVRSLSAVFLLATVLVSACADRRMEVLGPEEAVVPQATIFADAGGAILGGSTLLYAPRGTIYELDPGTGVSAAIQSDPRPYGYAIHPTWSPDRTKVVFSAYGPQGYHLWRMNADGSDPVQLTSGGYYAWEPAWSPDGAFIAFSANLGTGHHLWVMRSDGTGLRQLTTDEGSWGKVRPSWSPDSRRMAFRWEQSGRINIYVVDIETGSLTNLTSGFPAHTLEPSWSPDGFRIAFTSQDAIWTIGPDGSDPLRVAARPDGLMVTYVSWSPDGEWIAYAGYEYDTDRGSIFGVHLGSGEIRDFSQAGEREDHGRGDWGPPLPRPGRRFDCMDGGWERYGFSNQGRCIRFVETGR